MLVTSDNWNDYVSLNQYSIQVVFSKSTIDNYFINYYLITLCVCSVCSHCTVDIFCPTANQSIIWHPAPVGECRAPLTSITDHWSPITVSSCIAITWASQVISILHYCNLNEKTSRIIRNSWRNLCQVYILYTHCIHLKERWMSLLRWPFVVYNSTTTSTSLVCHQCTWSLQYIIVVIYLPLLSSPLLSLLSSSSFISQYFSFLHIHTWKHTSYISRNIQ